MPPYFTACPLLTAGLRRRLPARRRLRGPLCQGAGVTAPKKNNELLAMWPPVPRALRCTHLPCPRPLGRRGSDLRPVRALARTRSEAPRRVRRTPRLAGEEPTLHPALRDACGRALPRDDQRDGGPGGASPQQHGQGPRQDLHAAAGRPCRPARPRAIGVDDITIWEGHDSRIVVNDLDRRRPIWVGREGPHRSQQGLLLCHAGHPKDGAHPVCRDGQVDALSHLAHAPCTPGARDLRQVSYRAPPRRGARRHLPQRGPPPC